MIMMVTWWMVWMSRSRGAAALLSSVAKCKKLSRLRSGAHTADLLDFDLGVRACVQEVWAWLGVLGWWASVWEGMRVE